MEGTAGIYHYDGSKWYRVINQLPEAKVTFNADNPNATYPAPTFDPADRAAKTDFIYGSTTKVLTAGTLAAGGTSSLCSAGCLTLASTSAGTARVLPHTTAGSLTGKVTVERWIDVASRAKHWRTIDFPFSVAMTLSRVTAIAVDYTSGTRSVMNYTDGNDNGVYGSGGIRNAGYRSVENATYAIPAGQGVKTATATGFVHFGRVPRLDLSGQRVQTHVRWTAGCRCYWRPGRGAAVPEGGEGLSGEEVLPGRFLAFFGAG